MPVLVTPSKYLSDIQIINIHYQNTHKQSIFGPHDIVLIDLYKKYVLNTDACGGNTNNALIVGGNEAPILSTKKKQIGS